MLRAHVLFCLFSLLLCARVYAAAPESSVGENFSDALITRYQPTIDAMTHDGWDHSNSAILHGMEKIYQKSRNPAYLTYIKTFADGFIDADGSINDAHMLSTLDGMHPGVLCLFLYEELGEEKYKLAAKAMRDHFLGTKAKPSVFNKTPEGGYWHKNNDKYRNVMSVDGLYMVYPFLVRYGVLFDDMELIDLAVEQILLVSERSFNIKYNLPYHAWNYDKDKPWANMITGTSSQFWSRASGWYSMALVDVLEYLPKSHSKYHKIHYLYQQLAKGIKAAQNPADGFWYQVLDLYNKPTNYPESSGTGMMVYALQKGVNLHLLDESFHETAEKGWSALKKKITVFNDGGPQINSVAPPMGSQVDYEAYVAIRPISVPAAQGESYPHGYIGILMAASVMDK